MNLSMSMDFMSGRIEKRGFKFRSTNKFAKNSFIQGN